MPVDIKNVLVCDAVDEACVVLLKQNGINVSILGQSTILHFFFFVYVYIPHTYTFPIICSLLI